MAKICVFIEDELYTVKDKSEILDWTHPPEKIGDDTVVRLFNEDRIVRLLKSNRMVNNKLYLADIKRKEAWPYE
jgi:hypothetical protein